MPWPCWATAERTSATWRAAAMGPRWSADWMAHPASSRGHEPQAEPPDLHQDGPRTDRVRAPAPVAVRRPGRTRRKGPRNGPALTRRRRASGSSKPYVSATGQGSREGRCAYARSSRSRRRRKRQPRRAAHQHLVTTNDAEPPTRRQPRRRRGAPRLFEAGAAQGISLLDVTGEDVVAFCKERLQYHVLPGEMASPAQPRRRQEARRIARR